MSGASARQQTLPDGLADSIDKTTFGWSFFVAMTAGRTGAHAIFGGECEAQGSKKAAICGLCF